MILIDSVFRTRKNYYPQLFSEECKYVVKEKKITKYIIDEIKFLQILREKIDVENSDVENFDKEN